MSSRPVLLLAAALGCGPRPAGPPAPVPRSRIPETGPAEQVDPAPPLPVAPALPPPLQPIALASDAGVRIVFDGRGQDVVAVPGRVVVLAGDFVHVEGVDASTGRVAWRIAAQERAEGRHGLYPIGDRVLLQAGPRRIVLDAQVGARLSEHTADYYTRFDDRWAVARTLGTRRVEWGAWTPLDPGQSACAHTDGCALQLFRCDTGAPLGELFRSAEAGINHPVIPPPDPVCFQAPDLLGRVGERTLVRVEGETGALAVAALGPQGHVLWRSFSLGGVFGLNGEHGGDPATGVCWVAGHAAGAVAAYTCETGAPRWRAELGAREHPATTRARLAAPDRLLLERRDSQHLDLELRVLGSGKRLWQRRLAADRRVLLPGDDRRPPDDGARVGVILDLTSGDPRAELEIPAGETLWPDPTGGLVRLGGPALVEVDAAGVERRRVAVDTAGAVWLGARLIALQQAGRFVVLRRADLAPALILAGRYSVAPSSAALGDDALLFTEERAGEPLRIVLLRADLP